MTHCNYMSLKTLRSLINREFTIDEFLSKDAYAFKQDVCKSALFKGDLILKRL